MAEANWAILMRLPGEDGPQACDAGCARWGGRPHAHGHYDGLHNEATPFLTVYTYCSCGFLCGDPVQIDVRKRNPGKRMQEAGQVHFLAFMDHMREAHEIDIETDEDWIDRLSRLP